MNLILLIFLILIFMIIFFLCFAYFVSDAKLEEYQTKLQQHCRKYVSQYATYADIKNIVTLSTKPEGKEMGYGQGNTFFNPQDVATDFHLVSMRDVDVIDNTDLLSPKDKLLTAGISVSYITALCFLYICSMASLYV